MEEEQGMDWEVEVMEGDQGQRPMDLEMTTTGKESRGMDCVLDFIEENPIGVTIFPASLSATPCRWCSEQRRRLGSTRPQGLYCRRHKRDHRQGLHEDRPRDLGHPPRSRPPSVSPTHRVSHTSASTTTLKPAGFGSEPVILTACDGFVFFSVAIYNSYHFDEPTLQDYFVYRVSLSRMHGQPSLTRLLQNDPSSDFARCNVGLLRCDDGGGDDDGGGLNLCPTTFPSNTTSSPASEFPKAVGVTTHSMISTTSTQERGSGPPRCCTFFYHMTHKLHYIPLPEPSRLELPSKASADVFCDIAVDQSGHIRRVEHQITQVRPWSHSNGTYISDDWTVTTWSWKVTNPNSAFAWEGCWERDCKIVASHISRSLPKLLGQAASLPPL
ncbi:unnamed protein product [Miscanthus lutarioriparius]|uniref:DUF1618 domain-containing protein n=1 Tax=Miscanthus lutarioriparius TaxID=422564 RepID=A0A811NZ73_9POAL|nr:unnamed protein product [Miscanthus lutarioriparius]